MVVRTGGDATIADRSQKLVEGGLAEQGGCAVKYEEAIDLQIMTCPCLFHVTRSLSSPFEVHIFVRVSTPDCSRLLLRSENLLVTQDTSR